MLIWGSEVILSNWSVPQMFVPVVVLENRIVHECVLAENRWILCQKFGLGYLENPVGSVVQVFVPHVIACSISFWFWCF